MMMALAFYNAYQEHGTWVDRQVAAYDKGRFGHVELVFMDATLFNLNDNEHLSCSSSIRDKGVLQRFITYENLAIFGVDTLERRMKARWEMVYLRNASTEQINKAHRWFIEHETDTYNTLGIASFLFPWLRPIVKNINSDKFCSESCLGALQAAELDPFMFDFNGDNIVAEEQSPNRLYWISTGIWPNPPQK